MYRLCVILAAASLWLVGCKSEVIEYFPRPDAGATDVSDGSGDVAADGSESDVSAPAQWAGLPCEADRDCGSGRTCITREFLDGFGLNEDIQIPGGMCSKLNCSENDDCGPNGICLDGAALGSPISLCVGGCEDIRDCRWEESWDCVELSIVTPDNEDAACVSDSLHIAILCDDGSCDEEGSGQ